jgi:SAM-dependent methyltransferase
MTDTSTADRDWSAVAAAWDEHVDDIDEQSDAATLALLDRLALAPGDRVLELATGPGSLGPQLSQQVGPTGSVLLSDIAPGMVATAERRNAGLANVGVAVLDASAIDRADGSFDVVACRMGLMFAPDPALALAEIHRVLAPGGRFGALTWGGLEHNPWMTCVGMAAAMNGVVAGGPPVGPGGVFSLGDPDHLAALVEAAGFHDVVVDAHPLTFTAPDVDAHVARVSSLAGPLAAAFAAATPEQLAAVRSTAASLAAPSLTQDGLEIPGLALAVSARR